MTAFLQTLFHMSLTAGFVAVVVFLLRLALKGRAARQMICLLWLIVFARLLIPVTLQSPVSLVPDMELSDPAPAVSTAPEAVPTLPANTSPVATVPPNVSAPAVTNPVQNPVVTIPPNVSAPQPVVSAPVTELPPVEEVPPVTEEPTPFPWATVLTVVWAVGVAAMLVYGVASYLSIRRKLRFAIRTKEGWWEDPRLRSPFILGLIRPKIYLPCHMTPYARRFILCHERAHIRRGDHIVKPICWLALAIHWFNPLAWLAFLLLSRDIEVACDEKVLRQLGQEAKADYSATLLALATNGRFPAPTPLAFGEGDAKTRIKGVLSFKKPALWVTIAAVAVAIVAAVCLLTDPVDKFNPDDYTTLDCYPGLYFERTVVEETGETTVMAYRLDDQKPVLVAGWSDRPADNLATLIHPDGEREILLAVQWEMSYRYEQYLVDYMMEQDEGWARRYIEEADDLITIYSVSLADLQSSGQIGDLGGFYGGIAYTPEENLLFCRESTAQVLPRWTPYSPNAHTVKVYPYDRAEDGTDRLDILWTGEETTLAVSSVPGGLQTYTGDALITYLWDGGAWTAHNAADTIAHTDKPVRFDGETRIITVTYDPNAHTNGNPDIAHIDPGMIPRQFSIPEELGQIERVYVGEAARIARREDGDYDLTYGVYAVPEGGDPVRIADMTAILKWNALTKDFEITFTGAEPAADPVYTAIPADAETLADLNIASLHLLKDGTVLLRYGEEIVELRDFGWNEMRPDCRMWATDIDGDGVKQIHIIHQFGSGTGVSIDKLTTVTPTDRGLEVSYHDWTPQELDFETNNSFVYYPENNSIALTCGSEQLWLRLDDSFRALDWDSFGSQAIVATVAHYSLNPDGTINLSFAPALSDGSPMVHYLPMTANYTLKYQDGDIRQVGSCVLEADNEGMLVQPFTVTMLELDAPDDICNEFLLTLDGKEVKFKGSHMIDRDILTYYIDVTEDGVADPVVFLIPGEGTGYPRYGVHIFDGVTLAECPNTGNINARGSDGYIFTMEGDTFRITAEGGLKVSFTKEDVLAYWAWNPAYADINFLPTVQLRKDTSYITVKDGMLCVVFDCMVGDYWQSYGRLETYLVWKGGLFNSLMPVKTAFVAPDGTVTVGYPGKHTVTKRIAYLPEALVYLFADGENKVYLQTEEHYGPVLHLNAVGLSDDELSTITNLQRKSLPNLSGPEIIVISFEITIDGSTLTENLRWDEAQGGWELSGYASILGTLPNETVTPETLPTNPEWYYKVAEDGYYILYARNHGTEVLLQYGNFWWTFDHDAHSTRWSLPTMKMMDDETVAVISEVNTGTGVGVDELVVYDATLPVATDYLYDWRDLAAAFNRNNTLTYDKLSNSLTLSWNGSTYNSGRLAEDQSVWLGLEDGFTGALIATGEQVRFTMNEDGTFTLRMKTSIGRGNKGSFNNEGMEWFWRADGQANHYFPLSIGTTGFDLVWTVKFTGSGFEVTDGPAIVGTVGEAALQAYRSFLNGGRSAINAHSGESFTFSELSRQITPDETFRFEADQYALVDLDGDGWQELLLSVPNFGSVVLRFDAGPIYAYLFSTRQFSDVKTDGTFSASGGLTDNSLCRLSFSGQSYTVEQFTYSRSDGDSISFVVEHQPSTEAEWRAAVAVWQQRASVTWFDLPLE